MYLNAQQANQEGPHLNYALAMFLSRSDFECVMKNSEEGSDYDSLRQEIGDSYFQGNAGFTIHDALDATSADGAFDVPTSVGHGGTLDHTGGFDGGGDVGGGGGDAD